MNGAKDQWQSPDGSVTLRAPFPYFGGKRQVAEVVWARFGDCKNYVEPFAGSLAVLLARPHWPFVATRTETVNDADDHICNFWRALQNDPAGLAEAADYPVIETDLHAWHLWLTDPVSRNDFHQELMADRNYYDLERAGRWVNGQCQWIGSGWCHHPEWQQLPHLGNAGRGVHRPSQQLPHLGNAGSLPRAFAASVCAVAIGAGCAVRRQLSSRA